MLTGLYSAASTLAAAEQQHEAIAQNLAHAQMPGYRRVLLQESQTHANFAAELREASENNNGGLKTDFSHGAMIRTDNPLDLAIDGDAFFEVKNPNGQSFFTRNGAFRLSEEGTIQTVDGLNLADQSGKEIKIPPTTPFQEIEISSSGQVMINGAPIGDIKLVEFDDPQKLQRAGVSLFSAPEDVQPIESEALVLQHTREQANVSPIQELVALIETQRRYEAAQKSMTMLTESVQRHIDL